MKTILLITVLAISFAGCEGVHSSIKQYYAVAGQIQLGDSKERVFEILMPTQKKLPFDEMMFPDSYMEGNDLMEIHYFRSGRQPDNLTTDDEFTPYIFKNEVLIAIGWKTLGGPKSHGKVVPPANITNIEHTTIIEKH